MNDRTLDELIQDVLDDTASPEERGRLQRLAEEDPRVKARLAEMEELFDALRRVPMEEPPAGLHQDFMDALEAEPRPAPRRSGWMSELSAGFRLRPIPALAMSAISGAALGIAIWVGVTGSPLSQDGRADQVTGTMVPSALQPIDTKTLSLGQTRAIVKVLAVKGGVRAEIALSAPETVHLDVAFEPTHLQLVDMQWSRPQVGLVRHEPGHVVFEQQGENRYALRFETTDAGSEGLHVSIRSPLGTVEQTVETGSGGAGS